jgi:hypothetical protein
MGTFSFLMAAETLEPDGVMQNEKKRALTTTSTSGLPSLKK